MKDTIADHMKDWLTLMFTGLGVTFAPHEWLGGMFMALAAAAFAMRMEPEQDQRELWVVLVGAFLASHIAAMIAFRWIPDFPMQIVMIASGFLSRRVARITLIVAGKVEARGGTISDRLINWLLPNSDKEK